ncbi:MAG: nitrogen fixation protein FixH [Rhodobacterales bacterium RIFCSPHIGHO2_02_FULL_62_130]|jgi:nitrogen fixation protein FixH|nr:MAG: nitrogen fixation protein FixH [Rhodobacterales bacterium RIFCSPHIGHO2_02_FULL_62_130]OHC60888.1 MAG: nitrogen fixation protein FixH [Rhodobacterales bacterium RIFCSPHIGHO2_12_FULL_62_75]HCY99288.1 nitrogen fixation protein FixH [Rhodobacter sp.]
MRELTGRHVLGITVTAFAVIIGVNLVLAYKAVSTFPGLEVANSYVASQGFDAEKTAQMALGWTLDPIYDASRGELRLAFTDSKGQPAPVADLTVLLGRTTEAKDDTRPEFAREAGVYVAKAALQPGKWMMHVEARAMDGTLFRQRINLFVKG